MGQMMTDNEVLSAYTMTKRSTKEIGATGLRHFGGLVDEEQLQVLRGQRAAIIFEEMRNNDSTIGAFIYLTMSLIRQTKWRAVSNPDATSIEEGEKEQKFLEECVGDMSHTWSDFVTEILSMMWHGWAYFNRVYKYRMGKNPGDPTRNSKHDDNRLGWRKFAIRSQETLLEWMIDDDGGIRGMVQLAAPNYIRTELPIEECILFRTELAKNNPEGRSLLRNSYRSYYFLKRLQEIEAIGMERELVGLPKITLPNSYMEALASPKTDETTQRKRLAALAFATVGSQVRRNEHDVLLFPSSVNEDGTASQFNFELMASGGSRQIDISAAIKRYQFDVSAPVLNQFIFLATSGVGSYALSSDQTSNHAVAIGALLDVIEETFDRYATQELFELNGVRPENRPRWVHGDIEKEDLKKWVDNVTAAVSGSLVTPDETLETYVREKLELPEADEEDEDDISPPMNFGFGVGDVPAEGEQDEEAPVDEAQSPPDDDIDPDTEE